MRLFNASNVNTSSQDMPSLWIGDHSLYHPPGTKRKREGEEQVTRALTGNGRGDGLTRGYEVFLSFRGPDTRLTIADCLYEAMICAGICAFKDDPELRVGEEIGGCLLQAINDSQVYIPIFSKDYASSKWCLRELEHILECTKGRSRDNEKVILPIFYDVDVHDVKLHTDLYQKALQKHESNYGKDIAKQWEETLREVGKIKGRNLKDHGLHRLINLTVEEVSNLLWTRQTNVPDHLVGIKDRKDDIMKLLDQGSSDVQFIIIHGMGGIGKTTLAKVVFRQISPHFQGQCCFLSDVQTNDILNLQKKLLSDILHFKCTNLSDIDEGACMIKTKFHDMKVLIVLDDIGKLEHIKKLVGNSNWFGRGSRIIITTRNTHFLVTEEEDDHVPASYDGNTFFYEMQEMNHDDALQLFCECALGQAKPPPEYMDISGELIYALGRLPLALDVIGSTLFGKSRRTWEDVQQKLKKMMHEDVKEKLMISYKELDSIQQQIFLDIACFFINQEKTIAIKYWDAVFGYHTRTEVNILKHMSLIKIMDDGTLWMHDLLRDLGRDIVNPKSCKIHLRDSRLWSPKDSLYEVQREKGTENIVGLNLGTPKPRATYRFKHKELARLVKLRFLQLDHGNFKGDFKDLFLELRWLSWSNCLSKIRATNFGFENLVVLQLSGVNITHDWEGWCQIMVAKQLKVLELVDCSSLRRTPKFYAISKLERLILRNCTRLRKIDESVGNLEHLDYLEIECEALKSLPKSIGSLKSLSELSVESERLSMLPPSFGNLVKMKHLILRCSKLQELPHSIGQLKSLLELDIPFSEIRELPHSIGYLERLKVLKIRQCKLEKLPDSIGQLQSLLKLDLEETKIMGLPDCIGNLKKLKVINLDFTNIRELPQTIVMLGNLEELHASECEWLEWEIPSEIVALSSLRHLLLSSSQISRLPTTINQLSNLQKLGLYDCNQIQHLPELPNSLTSLSFSSSSLITIPDLSNLTNLVDLIFRGTLLQESDIGWLVRLRALRKLVVRFEDMILRPIDLSSLSQLQELQISCGIPKFLIGLPSSLQELTLVDVQSPIDWSIFSNLENLVRLSLDSCPLEEIQFDVLGELPKFSELAIERCPLLKTLPLLPSLKEIQCLRISFNCQLTEIQGLGELKSLRNLVIQYCRSIIKVTEDDLSKLQNLKSLYIFGCKLLEIVPDVPISCKIEVGHCPRFNGEGKSIHHMESVQLNTSHGTFVTDQVDFLECWLN